MNPSYQRRGRLWSSADKAYLVDSILNEFDVPKFYLADFTWGNSELNENQLPYAIIDGKQRFEAIFDFYDGKIQLQEDFEYRLIPRYKLGGLGYRDLRENHADVAEVFDNFVPHVMAVYAEEEKQINNLFVRLNRSKPLTGAEIRNAMGGPVPQVLRELAKHEFFAEIVRFSVKRGQDLNAAAKILLFEYYEEIRDTKKQNLDQFAQSVGTDKQKSLELSGRKIVDVLDDMSDVFLPRDRLLSSSGIVPVYYWFIRGRNRMELPRIRRFLVDFEDNRKENRKKLREEPGVGDVDHELTEYDNYNRSTNDDASHRGRVRILTKRFVK
ncbi:MAG: DUF262 domain-containing protein [Bryobacterales bacterium]|nr:DUF262 domain-containing protein [Bryobacterales bacterium]